jgi:phosphate uptake regulator
MVLIFYYIDMDHRKIMALGQSSRVVTLPQEWLRLNELDQGDTVLVRVQRDGSLVILPTAKLEEEVKHIHIRIAVDEDDESIVRKIVGTYLDGYTLITLKSENIFTARQQKAIRGIIRRLYMMVIESESNHIMLETLVDETKVSIPSCVERMHMMTYSMFRDTIQALKNKDESLVLSVVSLEEDVDQMMYLVVRTLRSAVSNPVLSNQLDLDPLDCLDYQTLVHLIERVADHVANIARSILALYEAETRIPDQLKRILSEAADIAFDSYDRAVHCFLRMDVGPTNDIIDTQVKIRDLYSEITPLPVNGDSNDVSMLTNIVTIRENIMRISNLTADIAELTIDRAYQVSQENGS